MVQLVLKRAYHKGHVCFELPAPEYREALGRELAKCRDKNNDFALVTIQQPKRPRTTGEGSQNHHLNSHVMQIANETGNAFESVKDAVKMTACENLGYPYDDIDGRIVPQRERVCSTDECAKLIEAAHILAADLGIILNEGD